MKDGVSLALGAATALVLAARVRGGSSSVAPPRFEIAWVRGGRGCVADLSVEENRQIAVQEVLGRRYRTEELLAIVGADGLPSTGPGGEPAVYSVGIFVNGYVSIEVRGGWIIQTMRRELWLAEDGRGVVCDNNGLFLYDEAPAGIGRAIFQSQVHAGRRLGVRELRTDAERYDAQGVVGYYVWARLGFDGETPQTTLGALARARRRRGLPEALRRGTFRNVQDFMQTEAGCAFWREHGDTFMGFYPLE